MTRPRLALLLAGALLASAAAAARAEESYDLIFRGGTLDAIAPDATLRYDHAVTNALDPDSAARQSGEVALSLAGATPGQAYLTLHQDGQERPIGAFPADVGNPVVMYFVETVVRDMAAAAGGSPFYIRNRVKAALAQPAEVEAVAIAQGPAQTVTLRPFAGDPNAARMRGFDALALTFTLSDAVPGWYHRLEAVVEGAEGAPTYRSVLTLEAE